MGQAVPPLRAQDALPPDAAAPAGGSVTAEWRVTDPPARVGRVAAVSGDVSFHTRDSDEWVPVSTNYPVAAGNAFWVEPDGQAQLDIGASRVALAGGTELEVAALDDNAVVLTVARGSALLDVRRVGPDETWSVPTPRGLVNLSGAGRYAVVAGDVSAPTQVAVLDGAAQITGPEVAVTVERGQTATLTGTDTIQAEVGSAEPPPALMALLQASPPPPPPPPAAAAAPVEPPPVVAQMPGGLALSSYGAWEQTPDDGPVWYPRVEPGWVPYRDGHWAYVQPWGWTWIDDAPWGFAPFHYGRWALYGGRWGWVPGGVVVAGPPVYAPALVTFFGVGAGVTLGAAFAAGSVGWWPLGPREPFRPWYRASPRYYHAVNNYVGVINNRNITINRYVNRGAATIVPRGAMAASYPVRRYGRPYDARSPAAFRPMVGAPPLRPTAATAGITPNAARRMHLGPPPAGFTAPHRGPAPGPAIRRMPATTSPGVRPPLWDPRRGAPLATAPGSTVPGGARTFGAPPSPGGLPPGGPSSGSRSPGGPSAGGPSAGSPSSGGPSRRSPGGPPFGGPTPGAPYRSTAPGSPPSAGRGPASQPFRASPAEPFRPPATQQPVRPGQPQSQPFRPGSPPQSQFRSPQPPPSFQGSRQQPQFQAPQPQVRPQPQQPFRQASPQQPFRGPPQQPGPQPQFRAPAPQQPSRPSPPPQSQFRSPPPASSFQAPQQPQFRQASPAPQFRPPPQPQFRPPPQPQARPSPPPQLRQAPAQRPSPPSQQHSQRRQGDR